MARDATVIGSGAHVRGKLTGEGDVEIQGRVDGDVQIDGEVTIQPDGAEQPFVYRGFQMVNEEKLADMRGDQLRKIHKNGMLPLIYAHLFSLSLMRDIFARQAQLGQTPQPQMAAPTPFNV